MGVRVSSAYTCTEQSEASKCNVKQCSGYAGTMYSSFLRCVIEPHSGFGLLYFFGPAFHAGLIILNPIRDS